MRTLPVVAALGLLVCGAAGACDPVLLTLIRGQDRSSVFDRSVEQLSTRLNDVAARARLGQWAQGLTGLSEVQRDWVGLYSSFYLSKEASGSRQQEWQTTFDTVSKLLGELDVAYRRHDFEKLHPVVKEIQERLIRFYQRRTGDSPTARFDRAREAARVLVAAAAKPGLPRSELGEAYLGLERSAAELPMVQVTSRDDVFQKLRACDQALRGGHPLREQAVQVQKAVETYRQEALARLWFETPPTDPKAGKP